MSLQSLVERLHKGKVMQCDELSKTVMSAFDKISKEILHKVYTRWRLVLNLIISGKGNNEVVKEHQGLQKPLIIDDLPSVPDSECIKDKTYHYDSCSDDNDSDSIEEEVDDFILKQDEPSVSLELAYDNTSGQFPTGLPA